MIKRSRPRQNNNGRTYNRAPQNGYTGVKNNNNDDSSELRLKPRGHYQQMYDKYSTAARESLSMGERIEAECHFQHAEHYFRMLNERIRHDNEQQQQQQHRQAQRQAQHQRNHQDGDQNDVQNSGADMVGQDEQDASANAASHNGAMSHNGTAGAQSSDNRPNNQRRVRAPHQRRERPTHVTAADDSTANSHTNNPRTDHTNNPRTDDEQSGTVPVHNTRTSDMRTNNVRSRGTAIDQDAHADVDTTAPKRVARMPMRRSPRPQEDASSANPSAETGQS